MRTLKLIGAALALMLVTSSGALAAIVAKIDISSQTMHVYVNGTLTYTWSVSTAKRGYATPRGSYRPTALKRMHYSTRYHGSPMPHSVFFRGGYAIHGTGYVSQLGRPASHGCVRLHPSNAATLFSLIQRHGSGNTRIQIQS